MKFNLLKEGIAAGICLSPDSEDRKGLIHVAGIFAGDVELVTSVRPQIEEELTDQPQVIVGTIGKSPLLLQLEKDGALETSELKGKRESFLVQLITYNNTEKLVIAGTETVSTLHGIYHLSKKIGVSPWVYWADVKPAHREELIFDENINFVSAIGEIPWFLYERRVAVPR